MTIRSLLSGVMLLCVFATLGLAQAGSSTSRADEKMTDVTFKSVDVKEAIKNLGVQLKLNVVFDESVRIPGKLDLELKDVTLGTTLKIILLQTKLRAGVIQGNTLYIYADTPPLREKFAEFKLWEPKSSQR